MLVRRMTTSDASHVADVGFASFSQDELFTWLYPQVSQHPDDLRRFQLLRCRQRLVEPGIVGFVAVTEAGDTDWDGSSRIIAYAFWHRRGGDEKGLAWQTDSVAKRIERALLQAEGWYQRHFVDQATAWERVEQFSRATRYDYYDELDASWHLEVLAVRPEFQRRGIATRLIEWGTATAAGEGVPITLEASRAGRQLYERLGFVIFEKATITDELEGVAMMWEPPQFRGRWLQQLQKSRE